MKILKAAAAILIATTLAASCNNSSRYVLIQGYAQGGTYSVKLNLNGEKGRIHKNAAALKMEIDSILNVIDTTLSGYNKGSLLSRFNSGKAIPSARYDMFEDIYTRAYDYYEETGGALDVASAPLFDLWGFGFTRDSLPSESQVDAVRHSCGMARLKRDMHTAVDAEGQLNPRNLLTDSAKVFVNAEVISPVKLNYNAIAQGYSCDVVADYLYSLGVKDMLVDIGEIYCDGVNQQGEPWKVGVDRPFDGNNNPGANLDGIWQGDGSPCGIVTSGNYRKYYVKDGKKYAHTIDPRTGYPVEHNLLSATIVAKNATDADAFATYCMVIGLEEAKKFIGSRPDDIAGYLIYSDENGDMKEWASENFNLIKK